MTNVSQIINMVNMQPKHMVFVTPHRNVSIVEESIDLIVQLDMDRAVFVSISADYKQLIIRLL